MSKKIGRNEPCPCGSGKKYKRCCMLSDQLKNGLDDNKREPLKYSGLDAPKIHAYLSSHDSAPVLDYLIALQLNPKNHGKNLRIEHLAQLAVSSLGKGHLCPDTSVLKALIDEEYPYDVMEDLPMNMFTETVVFYGGNYVYYPGLSTNVAEMFRSMTEAIYYSDDVFREAFRQEVYQGVTILLELGKFISSHANIKGMVRGNDNPREIIYEPLTNHSYKISDKMMMEMVDHFGWNKYVIESYILDKEDPKLLTENPEENPILYKPIVHHNGFYYFLGIANQGCAINNFILKTALKHNCLGELVDQTQSIIWIRILSSCFEYLHWQPGVACDLLHKDSHYNEELFQIDVNWIAYVCYAKDSSDNVSIDGQDKFAKWDMSSHLSTMLKTLKKDDRTKDFHVFTLILYSSMGERFGLSTSNQPNSDYLLLFSAFDFLQLVQTEKWDSMSLVRFARTYETKSYLNTPYNQIIDIYSIYKHYGESFYITEKTVPTFLQIEPNDGCHLIFESKEQLNFHGTLISINGQYAHITVKRDMDYADIYKPIDSHITAKSCESYTIPVWARCSQREENGPNPSSIIDTVITAIVFWMDVMNPSINDLLTKQYQETVEIEVCFNDDVLSDKELHSELALPKSGGTLTVAKGGKGVTVCMDRDFILSFMGSNNAGERTMMAKIIKGLLNLDDTEVQEIIDKSIPLGPAKMILMTEVSNNPMASPLWLHSPIYIHPATSQLLLDLFPKWMIEHGHIITKLNSKQEKDNFLHAGVDVLLEKLAERINQYDTKLLLNMLIDNHETLVYQREHNKVLQPAQILCFGDSSNKRERFFEDEKRLTESGLATRALIEYLAATQNQTGKDQPGSDDVEGLLAIMNEVIGIGGICDAIHLDVANHNIEMLDSGRYGIYDEDFNDNIAGFANARSVETVNQCLDDFGNNMERLAIHEVKTITAEKDEEHIKIDKAFESDWGITYSNILQFLYSCHLVAFKQQMSIIEIAERDLISEILKLCPEMTFDVAENCLNRLSLDKRENYLVPPVGIEVRDIFPWVYNRELSYLRRPIVRYRQYDEQVQCMFGLRSCLLAGLQLIDLLYSGRLRYVGEKLKTLLGQFEAQKGRVFNEEVRTMLQQIPSLTVWPHDISIKPQGNLNVNTENVNYGDIDVLAYDSKNNVLYSIECKNTNSAKNVKEMKTEMDEYLGRGENIKKDHKKALVLKHLRRHKWIVNNLEQVKSFIGTTSNPIIKSMLLTSTVIPTSYLKKEESPLSILNFPDLKLKGLGYLNSCKDPDVSILEC